MAHPANSNSTLQNFAPTQSVQTGTEEGEWMYLSKASEVTGLHEKTLRRYIKKRQLRSRRLGKQTNSPLQVWITQEDIQTFEAEAEHVSETELFQEDEEDIEVQETQPQTEMQKSATSTASEEIEKIVRTIAQQFAEKLDQQKELIFELKQEINEKDTQLRLLPDLQKKMEEQEKLTEFEKTALQKQLDQLQVELEVLRAEKAKLEQKHTPWWKSWFGGN